VGALAVFLELPPEIVSVHFLVSILLLTAATFAWHASGNLTRVRLAQGARLRVSAAIVMLLTLLGVIVAGVLTTASGPHSGASGTGQVVDRFDILQLAVTVHARSAFVFLVVVLVLTRLRQARRVALRDLGTLLALVAVQIVIGEVQYRNGLPWAIVLVHVATAAALWALTTRIAVDAVFPITDPLPVIDAPIPTSTRMIA
jgi:cytochrome c oxidase assembly protein subunit 15